MLVWISDAGLLRAERLGRIRLLSSSWSTESDQLTFRPALKSASREASIGCFQTVLMSDLRLLSMESLFLASVSGLLTIKSLAGLGLSLGSGLLSRCCKAVWQPIVTSSHACPKFVICSTVEYQLNISGSARCTQTGHFQN